MFFFSRETICEVQERKEKYYSEKNWCPTAESLPGSGRVSQSPITVFCRFVFWTIPPSLFSCSIAVF